MSEPAQALTKDQLAQILRLAEQHPNGPAPTGVLMRYADDWEVPYSLVAHDYISCTVSDAGRSRRTENRPATMPHRHEQSPPERRAPAPASLTVPQRPAQSAVAGMRAAAGTVHKLSKNWVLINARIRSPYEPRDIATALEPPLSVAEYRRVEDGELWPSADQEVQICRLLGTKLEETFVMAGPDRPTGKRSRGFIRGLAVVAILRARRGKNMREMAEEIYALTGTKVAATLIGRIERGEVTADKLEADQTAAIALYLDIPDDWVLQQVPPDLVQLAASNNAKLHSAIQYAVSQLTPVDVEKPHLLGAGGDPS